MSHIANHIEAKDKHLIDILTNNRFKIDVFQREYRWKRKHIEALISDLYSSFMRNYEDGMTLEDVETFDFYYMGPIVLCQDSKKGLSVIDGQQRLTSLTLLLIYMMHLQDELSLTEAEQHSFQNYLYVKKGGKNSLVLDVQARSEVMEKLINNKDTTGIYEKMGTTDESVLNILDRYDDISNLYPEKLKRKEVFPLFTEWLVNNVTLVEIKAFTLDNAYVIFETMNDRGMSLNPTEIIKAFMLSKISNEDQAEEMNNFWKNRMLEIKTLAGDDGDMSFFRAWLRARYAVTKRSKTANSENEDFENIGSQFHSWMKNNTNILGLNTSKDYFLFIKSDFDFYSTLYMHILQCRNRQSEELPMLYVVSNYCIADSLYIPLMMAPISKLDDTEAINQKLDKINTFVDKYINLRTLQSKSVTQSTIRDAFYDLIKDLRYSSIDDMDSILSNRLDKSIDKELLSSKKFSPSYMHYFHARIKYYLKSANGDFSGLLRSRRQSSFVLYQIIKETDYLPEELSNRIPYINSIANYCLVPRLEISKFDSEDVKQRLLSLNHEEYLLDMQNETFDNEFDFWQKRMQQLFLIIEKMWNCN